MLSGTLSDFARVKSSVIKYKDFELLLILVTEVFQERLEGSAVTPKAFPVSGDYRLRGEKAPNK